MRGTMELIAIEIICLVITVATLVMMTRTSFTVDGTRITPFIRSYIAFIIYLSSAIIIHLQGAQVIALMPALLKTLFFLHIFVIPVFIIIWFSDTERRILQSTTKRSILITQIVLVAFFVAASLIDIPRSHLFVFNGAGVWEGGNGVWLMLALSTVLTLISYGSFLLFRVMLTRFNLFGLLVTSITVITSLFFYAFFAHPYLFSTVGTSILYSAFWSGSVELTRPLTKIPNYTSCRNRLRQLTSMRENTIFMIDIENFRLINDRYGTAIGDRVLAAFAASSSLVGTRLPPFPTASPSYQNGSAIPKLSESSTPSAPRRHRDGN